MNFPNKNFSLIKQNIYGISDLWHWFASYLRDINKAESVKINHSISSKFTVSSGVPQGFHLRPLLFCIFVNSMGNNLSSEFSLLPSASRI